MLGTLSSPRYFVVPHLNTLIQNLNYGATYGCPALGLVTKAGQLHYTCT